MSGTLFEPLKVGAVSLQHRVVMAPMTRMRAVRPGNTAGPLTVEYYRQRASHGGLLISEGCQISAAAQGAPGTPGIHSEEQVAAWAKVTQAVHDEGGLIVLQLWHVGRVSHSSLLPAGLKPVGPSAIALPGTVSTVESLQVPFETPHALTVDEIQAVVREFAHATRNARLAGFDGVEIHGANGYLIEQFLQSRSNQRTDAYGGSIEHRARFALEVTEAVVRAWSSERVGFRLSPYGVANGSGDDDPAALYTHVIERLAPLGLAYLHLVEPRASGAGRADVDHQGVPSAAALFRIAWPGVLIAAGNFTPALAEQALAGGVVDAVAFGRHFISNPDLPARIRHGMPLAPYDRATFYSDGARGYTDYLPAGSSTAM